MKQSTVLFSCLTAIALLSLAVLGSHSVLGQTTDFQAELLNYAGQQAVAHGAIVFAVLGATIAFAVGFNKIPYFRSKQGRRWLPCWGHYLVLSGLLAVTFRSIFGFIFWSAIANSTLYNPNPCKPEACQDLTEYWTHILDLNPNVHELFGTGLWNFSSFPYLTVQFVVVAILGLIAGFVVTRLSRVVSAQSEESSVN